MCRGVSTSPSTYHSIVGNLVATFQELHLKLNITEAVTCVPAHKGIKGNERDNSEARAAARQVATAPNTHTSLAGTHTCLLDAPSFKEIAKKRCRKAP